MKTYDAIVVGAGHNGLTTAAYLAKAGLDVVCVEKNDYIGGATVSRNLYKDWWYSNCSYVCSLLRPEIYRSLELHKHGLQITPFGGSVTFMENGDYYGSYTTQKQSIVKWHFSRATTLTLISRTQRTRCGSAGSFVTFCSVPRPTQRPSSPKT